jgi:hypothetical protein
LWRGRDALSGATLVFHPPDFLTRCPSTWYYISQNVMEI